MPEFNDANVKVKDLGKFSVHPDKPTELVFGLVGGLGTDWNRFCQLLKERLSLYGYQTTVIHISRELIPSLVTETEPQGSKFEKSKWRIDAGNALREKSGNNAILALAAAAKIRNGRPDVTDPSFALRRHAYIVRSLKHQDEVAEFRKIYQNGFFLLGLHTPEDRRVELLSQTGEGMTKEEANALLEIDRRETKKHGQHYEDTFQLSDFFLADEGKDGKLQYAVWRCLDLVFGHPRITPTFNEFAMFMAFTSSLRSGDMNRQVGAVIAKNKDILATGANDAPRPEGGLYYPFFDGDRVTDVPRGRDFERERDSNTAMRLRIATEAGKALGKEDAESLKALEGTLLWNITEYGRSVHAEMEALLACARNGVSARGATLYCTTFPCHNCARHIIAAGISEVIYVEPYPKSLALDLHDDALTTRRRDEKDIRVLFKPFIGVGPRQFFNLFGMSIGVGRSVERKKNDGTGELCPWPDSRGYLPRMAMLPVSYDQHEEGAERYMTRVVGGPNQEVQK